MGPGNRVGLHQFLNAVLPEDPGGHRMRGGGVQTVSCPICSGGYFREMTAGIDRTLLSASAGLVNHRQIKKGRPPWEGPPKAKERSP